MSTNRTCALVSKSYAELTRPLHSGTPMTVLGVNFTVIEDFFGLVLSDKTIHFIEMQRTASNQATLSVMWPPQLSVGGTAC